MRRTITHHLTDAPDSPTLILRPLTATEWRDLARRFATELPQPGPKPLSETARVIAAFADVVRGQLVSHRGMPPGFSADTIEDYLSVAEMQSAIGALLRDGWSLVAERQKRPKRRIWPVNRAVL